MNDPQVLLDGLAMGESPRWHEGRLWLCDWGAREIVAVDAAGRRATIAHLNSAPFSIDWLPDGTLLAVAGREARVFAMRSDGTLVSHADLGGLSRMPWNEIVVDDAGTAYINNIGFEFPGGSYRPGTIAALAPDGSVRAIAADLAFPNGMAITSDSRSLIVAESYGECLTAFDLNDDGTLGARRIWAATPGHHPDGICIDGDGAVWYADVAGKVCVRVAQGGRRLDTVEFDRGAFACMLGGTDGRTLFAVVADYSDPAALFAGDRRTGIVYALPAPAAHAGRP
jgi:sugar lactone lactonase YvrE